MSSQPINWQGGSAQPVFPTPEIPYQPGMPIAPFKVGKVLRSAKPYLIITPTNWTSTVGETQVTATPPTAFDVYIRGGTTELSLRNRIRMSDQSKKYEVAADPVFLANYFGQVFNNEIYRQWRRPYSLPENQSLRISAINDLGNANGNLVFMCENTKWYLWHVIDSDCAELQLDIEFKFTGTPNETPQGKTALQSDYDALILGTSYTGSPGLNTVSLLDESASYSWSLLPQRFEYFFGMTGQPQPILWYPFPVYLPFNRKIILAANNLTSPATNGTVFACFNCIKGFSTFQTEAEARAYARRKYGVSATQPAQM